jgi:hypothetical protein
MALCVVITSRMDPGLRCLIWQKRTATGVPSHLVKCQPVVRLQRTRAANHSIGIDDMMPPERRRESRSRCACTSKL